MTCPTHIPVVTESPNGDYVRTDCRNCGMTMEPELEEVLPEVSVDNVDVEIPEQMTDEAMQAVYDEAFAAGILEEPVLVTGLFPAPTAVRLEEIEGERVLIETIAGLAAPEAD